MTIWIVIKIDFQSIISECGQYRPLSIEDIAKRYIWCATNDSCCFLADIFHLFFCWRVFCIAFW